MLWKKQLRLVLDKISDFSPPLDVTSRADFEKSSDAFHAKNTFPVYSVRSVNIKMTEEEFLANANSCYPLVAEKSLSLFCAFLCLKRKFGTEKERSLYSNMNLLQFVDRLLTNRPLVFVGGADAYLTRDTAVRGRGGFESIGSVEERPPLIIDDYLSYDEIALSALLNVSGPTATINTGGRHNSGVPGGKAFEPHAIYVGLVGARFEKKGVMESRAMMINRNQNVSSSGYGIKDRSLDNEDPQSVLDLMAMAYDQPFGFPTYEEISSPTAFVMERVTMEAVKPVESFHGTDYFHAEVYKKRMRLSVEPFLLEAERRGKLASKKVYAHVVGLGLGVWRVYEGQNALFVDVFADVLRDSRFEWISDLDFSWMRHDCCGDAKDGQVFPGTQIKIHFSSRDPFAKLKDSGKLIVASWAWDANSYIGNEFWESALTASGDPAAACCSQIAELLNPRINPKISGANLHVASSALGVVDLKTYMQQIL